MLENLERAKGFEPSTPTLARSCSTPELHPRPNSGRAMAAGLSSTYAKRTEALQPSLQRSLPQPLLWQSRPRAMKRAAIMDASSKLGTDQILDALVTEGLGHLFMVP